MQKVSCVIFFVFLLVVAFVQKTFSQKCPVLGVDGLEHVVSLEDHSEALLHWAQEGIQNAVLLNIDAHDDMRVISGDKISRLRKIYGRGDWEGLRAADTGGEQGLYHVGNFIYAAAKLGIVNNVYWVIPFDYFSSPNREQDLQAFLRTYGFPEDAVKTFRSKGGRVCGVYREIPVHVCGIENLPDIDAPLLLSIDVDFIPPLARSQGPDETSALITLFEALHKKKYKIKDALMAYSVNGGYLSVTERWIGLQCLDLLKHPEMVGRPLPRVWLLRQLAHTYYCTDNPKSLLGLVLPYLRSHQKDATLMTYAAFGFCGMGDLHTSFKYAHYVCRNNPVYCYALADIGQCLLDSNQKQDAIKFFETAYGINPHMNFRQKELADALKKAGDYEQALHYYEITRKKNGSFPVDFLMGELFLHLGEEDVALVHFVRGVENLRKDPYAAIHGDIDSKAVQKAMGFLKRQGLDQHADFIDKRLFPE